MATKTQFIELRDGLLVEVATDEEAVQQISAGAANRVEQAMDGAQALLKKAVQPVVSVWNVLNRDLSIEEMEVQRALGFEAEGNLYITRDTGLANIPFTQTVPPKKNDQPESVTRWQSTICLMASACRKRYLRCDRIFGAHSKVVPSTEQMWVMS